MKGCLGCLNSIFKIWPDKICTMGEKNTGRKGREGSVQVKQHHTGLIVSADYIIFSTEPGVSDNPQFLGTLNCQVIGMYTPVVEVFQRVGKARGRRSSVSKFNPSVLHDHISSQAETA